MSCLCIEPQIKEVTCIAKFVLFNVNFGDAHSILLTMSILVVHIQLSKHISIDRVMVCTKHLSKMIEYYVSSLQQSFNLSNTHAVSCKGL